MTGRPVLLKAVCDKAGKTPHVLAEVFACPDGHHEVELWAAVRDVGGMTPRRTTEPLADEVDGQLAYCRTCRKEYVLVVAALRAAVERRQRWLVLPARQDVKRDPFRASP